MERALALIRHRVAPPGRGLAVRTLWADEDAERLADALADLRSPPLFGGAQLLVLRHAEALGDEAQERILDVLPALDAGGSLVLVGRGVDPRRRLFAACGRAGVAYVFPSLTDGRAVREWAVRLARDRGHAIAPAAVEELVDRSGHDLGVLSSEVEKLSLHAGAGARIEPAHVRAVVAQVRTHALEELTNRLARRDLRGAARALRGLLAEGEPPIRLAAFLAANLRRALHVAELADAGLGPGRSPPGSGCRPGSCGATWGEGMHRT